MCGWVQHLCSHTRFPHFVFNALSSIFDVGIFCFGAKYYQHAIPKCFNNYIPINYCKMFVAKCCQYHDVVSACFLAMIPDSNTSKPSKYFVKTFEGMSEHMFLCVSSWLFLDEPVFSCFGTKSPAEKWIFNWWFMWHLISGLPCSLATHCLQSYQRVALTWNCCFGCSIQVKKSEHEHGFQELLGLTKTSCWFAWKLHECAFVFHVLTFWGMFFRHTVLQFTT